MWIVKLGKNARHSAWNSKAEALHQAKVLKDHGIIKPHGRQTLRKDYIEFDETCQCENGHYYV